jgi:tail tube protein
MDTKGGRCTMTINGQSFSARAKATINPSTVNRKNGANWDGKGYSTVTPKLAKLSLTFDRGSGVKWDAAMMLQEVNVTFSEDDTGVTHLFTGSRWDGDPSIDTETGEVTGLSIETDRYLSV